MMIFVIMTEIRRETLLIIQLHKRAIEPLSYGYIGHCAEYFVQLVDKLLHGVYLGKVVHQCRAVSAVRIINKQSLCQSALYSAA